MIEPRPDQRKALDALHDAVAAGIRRPLLVQPTGVGKTVVFAHWLKELREQHPTMRAVVLAHRDELIDQARRKLHTIDRDCKPGTIKGERNDVEARTIVASVQTLCRPKRLDQLMRAGPPDVVVVDEAHHARADTYQRILHTFGCYEPVGALCLGVTATPERMDGKALGKTFEQIVYRMPLLRAIKKGLLVPPKALAVKTAGDFNALRTRGGDLLDGDIGKLMLRTAAPARIAEAMAAYCSERKKIVVFAPTIDVSKQIAFELGIQGVIARHLDGTTPDDQRHRTLKDFHDGAFRVLCNCAVLTEGYDEPAVDCIVMARPTKSRILYTQCIGRGLRIFPGKSNCLILDVVGVTHRHDLMTVEKLASEDAEHDVVTREEREPGIRAIEPPDDSPLDFGAVDLFATRPFAWVKTDFGYVLDLARNGYIGLSETQGQWAIHRLMKHYPSRELTLEHIESAEELGYAQGIAEQFIRDLGLEALAKADAGWRDQPMSPPQRNMMQLWKIPFHPKWTKGQCAEELTRKIANVEFQRAWGRA